MPYDTSVKYIHSGMTNAPAITGNVPGSLLAVLNACLVTGFGSQAVDSIVVVSGVATVTRALGHPFEEHQVPLIAGATPSGLNGQKRILSVSGNTYTFDATGISDQTATGSITHAVAPLGWVKPFADAGNIGVFKSAAGPASGCILRVDDSGSLIARTRGYETMSALSVGTNRFPEDAMSSGGYYVPRSNTSDASTRPWVLIGDDRFFMLLQAFSSFSGTTRYSSLCSFGDFLSAKTGATPYECILHGSNQPAINTYSPDNSWVLDYNTNGDFSLIAAVRDFSGLTSPTYMRRGWSPFPTTVVAAAHFSGIGGGIYPNRCDNSLYVTPLILAEATNGYRGVVPGVYCTSQTVGTAFASKDSVKGAVGLPGNRILKAFCNGASNSAMFIDITGPWR